jgi:hypothetical protein
MNEKTMLRLVKMTNFLLEVADGDYTEDGAIKAARKLIGELDINYNFETDVGSKRR